MAVAYVASRALAAGWNKLADNVWVSQHAPFFTRIAEDERPTYTMLAGGVIGLWATIWAYRRDDIRIWTNEAAAELASLGHLFERMVPGGILILDDYEWAGVYRGQKLAEDVWFEARKYRVMPLPTGQGLVIKR